MFLPRTPYTMVSSQGSDLRLFLLMLSAKS